MSSRSTDVMPNLYIYIGETDSRFYKIALFTHSALEANLLREAILLKMITQSKEEYLADWRIACLREAEKASDMIKFNREQSVLAASQPTKFTEKVLPWFESGNEYYGRHGDVREVALVIFDKSEEIVYEFYLDKNKVEQKIIATVRGGLFRPQHISRPEDEKGPDNNGRCNIL